MKKLVVIFNGTLKFCNVPTNMKIGWASAASDFYGVGFKIHEGHFGYFLGRPFSLHVVYYIEWSRNGLHRCLASTNDPREKELLL